MKDKIKVLMTAVEAAPLAKVGGLADVIGSLPSALNYIDCEARVIIPKYHFIDNEKWGIERFGPSFSFNSGGRDYSVQLWRTDKAIKGVTLYLIENDEHFGGPDVYNQEFSRHESEKFLFFDLAVLESLPRLDFLPNIIHCHDFHCGLIPALLKNKRYKDLWSIKTLFTIHNFEYQGRSIPDVVSVANIKIDSLPSLLRDSEDGDINFMVQGIINSDLVTTVSPSYAKEIMDPKFAFGLSKITKANKSKIKGILNGIDVSVYDPSLDPYIKRNYSSFDLSGKEADKESLQKTVGISMRSDIPVVGFISRLFDQKGLALFGDWLASLDAQFIFLGTGDRAHEERLLDLSARYPGKIAAIIGFDEAMARRIYAGSDIFLMPSKFEPCGLGQMIAARYGTIPLVRRVGGLKDSVDSKIGFTFDRFSRTELEKCLKKAIKVYKNDKKCWLKLQKNCFKRDFSWQISAKKYLAEYSKLLKSQ